MFFYGVLNPFAHRFRLLPGGKGTKGTGGEERREGRTCGKQTRLPDGGVGTGKGVQGGVWAAAREWGQGGGAGDEHAGVRVYEEVTAASGEGDTDMGRHNTQGR